MDDNDQSELSGQDETPTPRSFFQILDAGSESDEDKGHLPQERSKPKFSPKILQTQQLSQESAQTRRTSEPPRSPLKDNMGDFLDRPSNPDQSDRG